MYLNEIVNGTINCDHTNTGKVKVKEVKSYFFTVLFRKEVKSCTCLGNKQGYSLADLVQQ